MTRKPASKVPKAKRRSSWGRRLKRSAALTALCLALFFAGIAYYQHTRLSGLVASRLDLLRSPPVTAIYARPLRAGTGQEQPDFLSSLYGSGREKKRYVAFAELPGPLVEAVLAAEDEHFFSHPGFDLLALVRASFVNLLRFEPVQGGSTLTQQFVKNYFLSPEKSFRRKLEEIYIAVLLESRLSKEQLFELYANEVYLGQHGSFAVRGFGEGARVFFGKEVQHLTLPEAAFLAGAIQAPNRFSPFRHPEAARARRNHILDLMARKELITGSQAEAAREEPLEVIPPDRYNYTQAPYFVDWVRQELDRHGVQRQNGISTLRVYTTLAPELQKAAYEAVAEGLEEVDRGLGRRGRQGVAQAALVAVDARSGEILALVGGRDYSRSQYNRAVYARRQPGSTFKPFVYAAALLRGMESPLHDGLTLSTLLLDEPHTFQFGNQEYTPGNYGEKYHGPVSLRQALALSLNVPTVKLAEQVGFEFVASLSLQAGIASALPYPSLALGSFEVSLLELVRGYTAFASGGRLLELRALTHYEGDGRKVEVPRSSPPRILPEEVGFLVTSALQSVLDEGTGREVRSRGFLLPAAGKTGTSDDSWFVGYTPDLLCGVWVGFDDFSPLGLTGAQTALPIWTSFMRKAQQAGFLSGASFPVPAGIRAVEIDPTTGLRASSRCDETRTEYYFTGTEPSELCSGRESDYRMVVHTDGPIEVQKKRRGGWGWLGRLFRR